MFSAHESGGGFEDECGSADSPRRPTRAARTSLTVKSLTFVKCRHGKSVEFIPKSFPSVLIRGRTAGGRLSVCSWAHEIFSIPPGLVIEVLKRSLLQTGKRRHV